MAEARTQNYDNHVRMVPGYHYVAFGILGINLIWSLYRLVRAFSADATLNLLVAVALLLLFFYTRVFALAVQDRVIRLEMRLRMEKLLPAGLQPRIPDFTLGQLIALRFASDEELPALAEKVLAENISDRKTIKKMVKVWNPDNLRA